jgi:hypothetical protein
MEEHVSEIVLRCVRLRAELKPMSHYLIGDPPEPLNPTWVGISRFVRSSPRIPEGRESYKLCFYDKQGEEITYNGFDTLEIALDQAKAIAGIRKDEWCECNIQVPESGEVPLSSVC